MRKKEIILVVALLVLGAVYIHFFTHWFEKPAIGIMASIRPNRRPGGSPFMVVFTLNGDYKLTSLKVLPMEDDKYNPLALPVWHLVSDSNSVPVKAFRYGQSIAGMKPALKGVHPDPLTPGMVYRLILSAGNATSYKDFKTQAVRE
jgi:hypothetical protein